MGYEIIVAMLSLLGTAIGSIAGILTANRLTNYRIQQLENKVDKHNRFAERIPVIDEKIAVMNHRIADLEENK